MARPMNVEQFYADYDKHPDHRIRLFAAVAEHVGSPPSVLYPGSYVDIAPSVFFDRVHYVDLDKRAARFFGQHDDVAKLVAQKRRGAGRPTKGVAFSFEHKDYRRRLDVDDRSVDLLVSLYAGFISESCTRYIRKGGHLFVNNSHGDASMASLDPGYRLAAVVNSRDGHYRLSTKSLETYLVPKRGEPPTVEGLHAAGRGVAYTKSPYAYLFAWDG